MHLDGLEVSAKAKFMRRRDGCVGQESPDGSSVCTVANTRSCKVANVRVKRLDQFGVFTPTRILATWHPAKHF